MKLDVGALPLKEVGSSVVTAITAQSFFACSNNAKFPLCLQTDVNFLYGMCENTRTVTPKFWKQL